MKVTATLDIEGTPTAVTIVDISLEITKIIITYIAPSGELFVVEKTRNLPGKVPTKIGDNAVSIS